MVYFQHRLYATLRSGHCWKDLLRTLPFAPLLKLQQEPDWTASQLLWECKRNAPGLSAADTLFPSPEAPRASGGAERALPSMEVELPDHVLDLLVRHEDGALVPGVQRADVERALRCVLAGVFARRRVVL